MIARIAFFLTLSCSPSAIAQTAMLCPWFTTGSAVKALGGDVSLTANVAGNFDGMCVFARGTSAVAPTIQIMVGKVDTHACAVGGTRLKALGNEAVQCETIIAGGRKGQTIAGRVREVYFVVTVTNVPAAPREPPADVRPLDPYTAPLLERVAEQVAGNLY